MDYLWSHWILVAFLAPFFWALVNIIDIYFVSGVYEDEWDGVIINSLFQLLPWLLPLFGLVEFVFPGWTATSIAFSSGAFLVLSYYFYFKTLFVSNDMVVVQALANLSVPLVPFLAWFLVGEQLAPVHYIGIAIAFAGAMLFSFHGEIKEKSFGKVFALMTGTFVFLALSMVFQTMAFQASGDDFWSCFLLFSSGATIVGLLISLLDHQSIRVRMKHIYGISRSFFTVFILAEVLNLLAVVALQRAIDLSPSVSFVAVIGSLAPVFVMVLSLILVLVLFGANRTKSRQIYQDQLVAFKTKIFACCIIALGIYLIS